ncbi:MAG: hypothetical protein EPO30_11370, partial [Lysobacteraceae bacterium]
DQYAVDDFVRTFDHGADCFIARGLGEEMPGDVINSYDTDYVMRRIRQRFIADSTVTIVLMGRCTWARRYVDWEIAASLRNTALSNANGLIGIKLPTFGGFPPRFDDNLIPYGSSQGDCYARWLEYPLTQYDLEAAVEAAFQRRQTHAQWIRNARLRMTNNRPC